MTPTDHASHHDAEPGSLADLATAWTDSPAADAQSVAAGLPTLESSETSCLTGSQVTHTMPPMSRRKATISGELRAAIKASEMSRYRIAQETGVDQAVLFRFIAGKSGLSIKSIDAIGELLGLKLVSDVKRRAAKPKRGT